MKKKENTIRIKELIDSGEFNSGTLWTGEKWERPNTRDINQIRSMIPMTDIALANLLDVDERTIRKWKTGETRMVFTTWCCLCLLATEINILEFK
ncbi:korC [Providencia rettgeri]|uniref:korC n=1 Tax=Providencia rettgeri TaxID=587 RepID=UPI0023624380|nr:korC [Providencia rettgeri]